MNNYLNAKVLVTGGTGFIGTRLAERLCLEENADVTVLVHNWHKAAWVSRSNIHLIQGDITKTDEIEAAIKGKEIVFHCVGVGGDLDNCMKINLEGTRNVLNAAVKHGIKRVVYLSSVVVHGAGIFEGMDEYAPYQNVGNPYAESKIEAEKYFLDFIKINPVEGAIIRPTYVWGPTSPYYTVAIIEQMKNHNFMMVDGGLGSCNAVHVDNVVDLALLCGYHPAAVGETFLITDGERITWKEFLSNYASMIGKEISDFKNIPSVDNFSRTFLIYMKRKLATVRDCLTFGADKINAKSPILARYGFKAPRKIIKLLLKYLEQRSPEMNSWDLKLFSAVGYISNQKTKKLLDYIPRKSILQGMEECKIWLKDQNYLDGTN